MPALCAGWLPISGSMSSHPAQLGYEVHGAKAATGTAARPMHVGLAHVEETISSC